MLEALFVIRRLASAKAVLPVVCGALHADLQRCF